MRAVTPSPPLVYPEGGATPLAHGPCLLTTQLSFFLSCFCSFVAVCARVGAARPCLRRVRSGGCASMARAAVGTIASWRLWLLPRRTPRGPLLRAPRAAMRVWCRVHRQEGEGAPARADGDQTTGGLSAGRQVCGGSLRRTGRCWSHPREVRAASCGDGVCGVLGGAPFFVD
ncbi:hypothetical protein TcG_10795, partial [Trypanosoma cruzi]